MTSTTMIDVGDARGLWSAASTICRASGYSALRRVRLAFIGDAHTPLEMRQNRLIVPHGRKGPLLDAVRAVQHLSETPASRGVWSTPLDDRLLRFLVRRALAEVDRRELTTPTGHDDGNYDLIDRDGSTVLISGEWWYEYSRRHGYRRLGAAYLAGIDDAGPWAIRVPRTVETVAAALEWATPAAARKAMSAGAEWRRQGDVLAVRQTRGSGLRDTRQVQDRHEFRPRADGGWTLTHPEHTPVRLRAGRWTIYHLRQDSGGGASRGCGD